MPLGRQTRRGAEGGAPNHLCRNARGRTRTCMGISPLGSLSPMRLPISPPERLQLHLGLGAANRAASRCWASKRSTKSSRPSRSLSWRQTSAPSLESLRWSSTSSLPPKSASIRARSRLNAWPPRCRPSRPAHPPLSPNQGSRTRSRSDAVHRMPRSIVRALKTNDETVPPPRCKRGSSARRVQGRRSLTSRPRGV